MYRTQQRKLARPQLNTRPLNLPSVIFLKVSVALQSRHFSAN